MIPSDHFVKFYAEVFKYLEKKGQKALDDYYTTIAEHQKMHCLKLFKEKGLAGMKEYWDTIIREENCDADTILEEGRSYTFIMHSCPSLGKVLDNDAEPCDVYCNHCPGWVLPVMTAAGFYDVEDLVGQDIPRCMFKVFADLEEARAYREVALKRHPKHPELVKSNF